MVCRCGAVDTESNAAPHSGDLDPKTNLATPEKIAWFARPVLWLYGIIGGALLAALVATVVWLGPLPPKAIVMSTGTQGSDYELFAQKYQAVLKRSGVQLRLLPSSGPVDNLRRLNDPRSGVSVAFAQGGLTSAAQSPELESLGTLFYEPFWLFVRRDDSGRPEDFRGKRFAIGPEGSGTRILAKTFLALNGIEENRVQLLPFAAVQAANALLRGEIDGAAMVSTWDTSVVRRLLASSDVNLVSAPRGDAYVALYPYLTRLVLPMGVGNLATNRPSSDVNLVAPEASLIVRKDLHPAIKYLLLEAATEIHSKVGLFRKAGQFPAPESVDLPISRDARQFYKSGPPLLQRYLPYGLAVLASRLLILLIPVIGVAYPLLRNAPAIYGWSMRRRIFRLYGELKFIEAELEARSGLTAEELSAQLQRLEERANHLQVPSAFAHFLYDLRNHIALVRARIQRVAPQPGKSLGEAPLSGSVPRPASAAHILGCAALLIAMAGCSLISVKSPEKPLSTRDLNARILTREQTAQFVTAVERCAQNIVMTEQDRAVLENGLRWEISAVSASRRAATQIAPMMSLLDSWALAVQMRAFVAAGAPGGALFRTHQATVREISDNFADGTERVAKRLMTAGDFEQYQAFVTGYARDYPLRDLSFDRPSVVELWSRERGGTRLVDSLGTIPEALTDAAQRVQLYGDTAPVQALRTTQLALLQSGYSRGDLQAELEKLDERLARLTAVAESAPELVQGAEDEVTRSVREVLEQLDAASTATAATLHTERAALFTNLQAERVAVVAAVDAQRQALAQDAARVADQLVKTSGEQVRRLTREALLLLIALTTIVLGLPFGAGYLMGRTRPRREPRAA